MMNDKSIQRTETTYTFHKFNTDLMEEEMKVKMFHSKQN